MPGMCFSSLQEAIRLSKREARCQAAEARQAGTSSTGWMGKSDKSSNVSRKATRSVAEADPAKKKSECRVTASSPSLGNRPPLRRRPIARPGTSSTSPTVPPMPVSVVDVSDDEVEETEVYSQKRVREKSRESSPKRYVISHGLLYLKLAK